MFVSAARTAVAAAIAAVVSSACLAAVPASVAAGLPEPPPASAAGPTIDGVFPVNGEPRQITAGPGGNAWFGVSSGDNDLASITPEGAITYYDLGATDIGWLTVGPDDNLWATVGNGVAKIPVDEPTGLTTYPIAGFNQGAGITVGPDDSLWAAAGDTLYKVPLADPVTATGFTKDGMSARQVTATSGRIWVADFGGKVHAFKTDGTSTTIPVDGSPQGIVAGAHGQVLFSAPAATGDYVARLDLNRAPQVTSLPGTDPSFGVAYGADGAYWVGLFLTRKIARITADGSKTEFGPFPDPYRPRFVTAGTDGSIWVSLQDPGNDGAIGRITGLAVDRRVSVDLKNTRVQVRRGKAEVRLGCPRTERHGPCSGEVTLRSQKGRHKVLGKRGFSIDRNETDTVKVQLGRKTLNQIGRNGLRVRAVIRVEDQVGNETTIRARIGLVR